MTKVTLSFAAAGSQVHQGAGYRDAGDGNGGAHHGVQLAHGQRRTNRSTSSSPICLPPEAA